MASNRPVTVFEESIRKTGVSPREVPFYPDKDTPEDFTCLLCEGLLHTPVLISCCGRNCCENCLSLWEDKGGNGCPFCEAQSLSYIRDPKAERQLKEMNVYCKQRKEGCLWSGPIEQVTSHLQSDCPLVSIPCPQNCGSLVKRGKLVEHMKAKCNVKWDECQHCQTVVPETAFKDHQSKCPKYPVKCPNGCGADVARGVLAEHDRECPNATVDCVFVKAGCGFTTMRRDMNEHVRTTMLDHLDAGYKYLLQQVELLTARLEKSHCEQQVQKEEIERLYRDSNAGRITLEQLKQKQKLIATSLNTELQYLAGQPHNSCVKNLAIECMRNQFASLSDPMYVSLSRDGNPVTFRLGNYKMIKASGQAWFSPPFTVKDGYQMCLSLHLNGSQEGRGTHLSVDVHLMSGIYDDNLKWPLNLEDEIIVSLMKQDDPTAKSKGRRDSGSLVQQQRIRKMAFSLHRINKEVGNAGLPFGYIAMYCASTIVESVVYKDSLVFQVTMGK